MISAGRERIFWHNLSIFTRFSLPWPYGKTKSKPVVQNYLEDLVTTGIPRISDPVGLGWRPKICIFNKLLGNAASPKTTL